MKKLLFATALVATAAAFADGEPTAINAISFEGYTSGDFTPPYTLVNGAAEQEETGGNKAYNYFCYKGDTDGSTVKAYGSESVTAPDIDIRPLFFQGATTNDKYLELSTEGGILWRSINPVTGSGASCDLGATTNITANGIYLDTLVQFTPTEDGGDPTLESDDKLAIWLNVDSSGAAPVTNLMVRANYWDYDNEDMSDPVATSFAVSGVEVQAGKWYRLTVKAIPSVIAQGVFPAFQIFIDGEAVSAATAPYSASFQEFVSSRWAEGMGALAAANQLFPTLVERPSSVSEVTLQAVGFKGSGALDDIVWTTEDPFAGGTGGDDAWIATVTQIFDGANLDAAEKAKITKWASDNSIVVDTKVEGQAEIAAAAYLLGLTSLPTAIPELTITSIEEGESAWTLTVAASVGDSALALPETINGAVMLTQSATLAGLSSASPATAYFSIANGTATVTVAKDAATAKFMKVGVGIAPAANAQQE